MNEEEHTRRLVQILNPIRWGHTERSLLIGCLVLGALNVLVSVYILVTL